MPFRINTLNFTTKNVHGNNYYGNNYHGTTVIITMKIFGYEIEQKYTKRHVFQSSRSWKKCLPKNETGESFLILDPQPYTLS